MEQRLSSPAAASGAAAGFGGLFLALGILFPLLFHLLPAGSGEIFLPMHIPVILAGMVLRARARRCGRSSYPLAEHPGRQHAPPARLPFMMVELGVYALAAGLCYRKARLPLPLSLAVTQLAGRAAYGLSLFFAGTLLHVPGPRPSRLSPPPSRAGRALWCSGCSFPLLLLALKKRRRSD